MHETDAALLAAALQERGTGRAEAFERILLRYEKLIHHIARRYFANAEDALDASQEAVLRVYKGLPNLRLDAEATLKAWICTVTANVCLDELRKKRPHTVEEAPETAAVETSAEEQAAARERVREILAALHQLPGPQRMVLILRDMQGLSYEELAVALEISVGTVKSRLSRAREALRKLLPENFW